VSDLQKKPFSWELNSGKRYSSNMHT
jgi:hypothetical protein